MISPRNYSVCCRSEFSAGRGSTLLLEMNDGSMLFLLSEELLLGHVSLIAKYLENKLLLCEVHAQSKKHRSNGC